MMTEATRWERAWDQAGGSPREGLLDELIARHAEPDRAYHTMRHVEECLAAFEPVTHQAERPAEIELAIWFHDAVYDTKAHDNEAQSAALAARELLAGGADAAAAARVERLILATRHDGIPEDVDARLLVDVDLAILGAEAERFAEYEAQVREEYAWVPEAAFRLGRARLLRSLLDRPSLYGTAWFRDRLEAAARRNLERSLRTLTG